MVIKENIWITPYQCERTLHIYIPSDRTDGERFAVLYMFDGHNLFYDEEATYGKSWGLKDYLDQHKTRLIVVGLECNHNGNERLSEFTPYPFYDEPWGYVEEKGLALIEWIIDELMPWTKAHLPVLSGRRYTYVGGSSMGGLMSLYMVLKHSDLFSKAVSVSPHNYPVYKQLREDLNTPMEPDTQVYISWGGQEYPDPYILAMATDQNLQIIRALLKKTGVDVIPHVFKNDDHSEAAWQKELPVWMEELGLAALESRKEADFSFTIQPLSLMYLQASVQMKLQLDAEMQPYLHCLFEEDHRMSREETISLLTGKGRIALIALVKKDPAGFALLDKTSGCVLYLYVKKQYRKKGIGSALMAACEKNARQLGQSRIWLQVLEGNQEAERFYRQQGLALSSKTMVKKISAG